jgi:hypothetical protein
MEPFVLEEFLVFVLLVVCAAVTVACLIKFMLARQQEDPRRQISRIVAECEARLATLRVTREKMQRISACLQATTAKWEAQSKQRRKQELITTTDDDLKQAVQARMDAEVRYKLSASAENTARIAIEEIDKNCADLERQLALAKVTQASLEARMAVASMKRDIQDDLGDGIGAALEQLELATAECEARADACVATSRYFDADASVSEDEVSAELARVQATAAKKGAAS